MLTDKEKVLRQWPDAQEQVVDGRTRIVIGNQQCANPFLKVSALSDDFLSATEAWKQAAGNAEAQRRLLEADPEAIQRGERIEVYVRNSRFIVLLKEGQPVGILIPGHSEDEPWGDALLTEAEKQEIYAAALEKLANPLPPTLFGD